ncbi:hypothetical protein ABI59_20450 [Acidobacteria bacterium Mor1]|nr:hypothetical protein ABI59_20450 [Acidobacteria bacterium Mor1]
MGNTERPIYMWDLLFDFSGLAERGFDAVAYFLMAIVGTGLFLLRLVFAGFGADGDVGDGDVDFDSDASFTFFSVLSLLAFFMGTGWMGLACRLDWDLGRAPSAAISLGTGVLMMSFASGLMYLTRRLNLRVDYDLQTAVGRTARVYLTIPQQGKGDGQVEVSVSGRKKVLPASSTGPKIPAFDAVKVVEVRDDGVLLVEPLEASGGNA